MTRTRIDLAVLGFVLLWPGCAPAQGNRVISGVVVNARTGAPVPGAELALQRTTDGKVVAQTLSDAEGHFVFPNLDDGKFGLLARGKGYVASAYQQHPPGVSTAIVTAESLVTTGLRFELSPLARITGTVQEDSGDPVPNARVSLYRKDTFSGTGGMVLVGGSSADAMGKFEFNRLSEGDYFACAFGTPWYATQFRPWHPPGAEEIGNRRRSILDVAYAPTCYPDVVDPAGSEPIRVHPGDVLPLTITMHPEPAVHIVIEIPRPDEKHPFMPLQFSTQIFGAEEQISTQASFTEENNGEHPSGVGRMEITGLTAGQYEVMTHGQNGETSRQLSADISPDHAALDLTAANPLPVVTGEAVTAGGGNLPPGSYVWLRGQHGRNGGIARFQPDGTFSFPGLHPDEYDVSVSTGQGERLAIARMASKGGELSGHVLKIVNQPVKLAIVTGEAKASVSGIAMSHGKPLSGVFILLVPSDSHSASEQLRTNQSDLDGSFNIPQVSAGNYIVVAIEQGWNLEWARPDVVAPFLARGEKIMVPAEAREINLPQGVEAQPANPNAAP